MITFNLNPMGKPRMTRADAWRKRPVVLHYYEFKDELNKQARKNKFKLGETLNIIFMIPMAVTWSAKKKEQYLGKPHQQKPDIDNLIKAFMDALSTEDCRVYKVTATKVWGDTGKIGVYEE